MCSAIGQRATDWSAIGGGAIGWSAIGWSAIGWSAIGVDCNWGGLQLGQTAIGADCNWGGLQLVATFLPSFSSCVLNCPESRASWGHPAVDQRVTNNLGQIGPPVVAEETYNRPLVRR